MRRLIYADNLIALCGIMAEKCDEVGEKIWSNFADVVKSVPTIDAVPVVHGHWVERTDYVGDTYYDCSVCGESWTTIEGDPCDNGMNYCPRCGALMDEVEE